MAKTNVAPLEWAHRLGVDMYDEHVLPEQLQLTPPPGPPTEGYG